ncbi:ABC-F family ATP-binding cassette domain-containing protein [Vicingus serpentipes]|uniref:Probable ATP-binding protein YbiT n=1 Tax=Vicingus serpentipes TaxID=1926625 RepID=A0A5C6RXZ2_9FLAO|nr:ABC-F family ATP-binding cassette domain-containing protein [Vicingus serpentipes]TXB67238.1 ABC-F family ATP-binding cassette domain-containing protein [Vicingus serpentipes]
MVGINELTVNFGERYLFNKVSFLINKQDRIGLVGKNGAGKSTMLKVIAGENVPDEGNVSFPADFTFGYLPQDMDFVHGRTVLEETKLVFEEVNKINDKIEEINHQLATRTDYESEEYLDLLNHLNDYNERLQFIGGFNIDGEIETILKGLGFTPKDFNRLTDEFSGGWRMRIELAKILLTKSNLLLLDEPTNHLDIESIQWLEDFLKEYPGAVVLISHDKAFLDHVTNRTIEISLGKVYDYKTYYSKYLEQRQERREQQIAAYTNQQKQIADTEKFIERFRSKATKAVQVQSRIKQLDKIERIEIEEEDNSSMRFFFPPAPRSGKVVVEARSLGKSFGEKEVFKDASFYVERGKKIAFVGKNGEGKTTMTKILVGELEHEGELVIGHNVEVAYFAQNQADELDKELTVFETIDKAAHGEIRKKVRNLLGAFMFGGEEADKKIKVLSGGERARVALCKLLLEPVNLLILDEPTNHLDIRSKEVLKDALKHYDGTLLVISHDRDFLDGLVEEMYEFKDGKVKEFLGGVYDFLKSKKVDSIREFEQVTKQVEKKEKEVSTSQLTYEEKKQLDKDIRKAQNRTNNLEKKIEELEGEIEKLNAKLLDPTLYSDELLVEYNEVKSSLDQAMIDWEESQLLEEELIRKKD